VRSTHVHQQPGNGIPPVAGIAEEVWHELLAGNQRFCDGRLSAHQIRTEREFLVSGQHPKAIVIGCSDSRVPPEMIFDQSLRDLFVIRSAGNVIDAIALGSVEYAVDHLGVRLVIVLGHDRCGAVQAACAGVANPSPNLASILAELKPSVAECAKESGTALIRDVVEKNAARMANALQYRSLVLSEAVSAGDLQIIATRYDLFTGEVLRVENPMKKIAVHSA
jgi:carbonic anhydrase